MLISSPDTPVNQRLQNEKSEQAAGSANLLMPRSSTQVLHCLPFRGKPVKSIYLMPYEIIMGLAQKISFEIMEFSVSNTSKDVSRMCLVSYKIE